MNIEKIDFKKLGIWGVLAYVVVIVLPTVIDALGQHNRNTISNATDYAVFLQDQISSLSKELNDCRNAFTSQGVGGFQEENNKPVATPFSGVSIYNEDYPIMIWELDKKGRLLRFNNHFMVNVLEPIGANPYTVVNLTWSEIFGKNIAQRWVSRDSLVLTTGVGSVREEVFENCSEDVSWWIKRTPVVDGQSVTGMKGVAILKKG